MAKIAKKVLGTDGVDFEFANGNILTAHLGSIPEHIITRLAVHGLSQKIGDSYASANEKGWTIQECHERATEVLQTLIEGNWSASGGSGINILVEAVARITGLDIDLCAMRIGNMTDAQQKELAKRADVKAMVATIKAERAKAKVKDGDTDASDLADLFI